MFAGVSGGGRLSALGDALLVAGIHQNTYGVRRYCWTFDSVSVDAAVYIQPDGSLIYRRTPTDHGWPYKPNLADAIGEDWYACDMVNQTL